MIRDSANSGACLAGQFTKASLQRRTKFGDGAFAARKLWTIAVDLAFPNRDVLFDLLTEVAREAKAHTGHLTRFGVCQDEKRVTRVDELPIDGGDGEQRARTAKSTVSDHVEPHSEQF